MRKTKTTVTAPSSDDVAASTSGVDVVPVWDTTMVSSWRPRRLCLYGFKVDENLAKYKDGGRRAEGGRRGQAGVLHKPEAQVNSFVLSETIPSSVCSKICSLHVHFDVKLWP